jgi:hypothetical protein
MPTGPVFTPAQVQIMLKAFEAVCTKLRLRPGARATEEVAISIVDFAAAGVLNLDTLTATTLAAAQKSGAPGSSGPETTDRAA